MRVDSFVNWTMKPMVSITSVVCKWWLWVKLWSSYWEILFYLLWYAWGNWPIWIRYGWHFSACSCVITVSISNYGVLVPCCATYGYSWSCFIAMLQLWLSTILYLLCTALGNGSIKGGIHIKDEIWMTSIRMISINSRLICNFLAFLLSALARFNILKYGYEWVRKLWSDRPFSEHVNAWWFFIELFSHQLYP